MDNVDSPFRTVHVVDDDEAIRDSLLWLIEGAGYLVSAYPDAESFLAALPHIEPGCVICDVRMPGLSGLQLFDELKRRQLPFPLIFLTGHGDVPMATGALRGGAIDFLEKPVDESVLLERLHEGFERLALEWSQRTEREAFAARFASLTPRERDVFHRVVAGYLNKQIADELAISIKTVEVYRARVMEKMGCRKVAELVALWAHHQQASG